VSDRLATVGDPELRDALLYARGEASPFTADDAAASLDVHRHFSRARLARAAPSSVIASSTSWLLLGWSSPLGDEPA